MPSPDEDIDIQWYPHHVEASVSVPFSGAIMNQLMDAAYGDARIETIRAMIVDMSECPSYELEPSDTHVSFAYQRSAASYTKITQSAMVTTNEQQIRDVRKFAELMATQGRDVRVFDTVDKARKWLGVENDVVGSWT